KMIGGDLQDFLEIAERFARLELGVPAVGAFEPARDFRLAVPAAVGPGFGALRRWRRADEDHSKRHEREPIPGKLARRFHLQTSGIGLPFSSTATRSEEHTSELQSRQYLVCR